MENDNRPSAGAPQAERKSKSKRGARALRTAGSWLFHFLKVTSFATAAIAAIAYAFIVQIVMPDTPEVDDLQAARTAKPSIVLDAEGTQIAMFRRGHQQWVGLDRISPHVIRALIATEDHRFYEHEGFDPSRTIAALFHTVKGDTQGGSTITQQLARNLYPEEIGRSRNAMRKLKEIMTAVKIERAYSKDQILETYLNTVPFLYNVLGIEMAARTYYGKSARELDVLESAMLVGMLKGTHYYNPVVNPSRAMARRNVVLAQMAKYQVISGEEWQSMREKPLQLHFARLPEQFGPSTHFTEHVRKWMLQWAQDNDRDLYNDGLVIHTTLDPVLQETAERAVEKQTEVLQAVADVEWGRRSESLMSQDPEAYARARKKVEPFGYFWSSRPDLVEAFIRESPRFRKEVAAGAKEDEVLARLRQDAAFMKELREGKTRLEAGFVAMDPATGEVKAWVGSRDFQRDQYDHVSQALRQPGSTFKPIVYGAALEQGFSPERTYTDRAVEIRFADGESWKPTDMGAPTGRSMSLREGLILSKNSITAQVMQDVGLTDIVSLAKAIGVASSRLDPVPSLALGTSPVTLLEMVSAYSTIARTGEFRQPVFVSRIADRDGNTLAEFVQEARGRRAMSETTAIELIDMMRGVVSRGTGAEVKSRFRISADIAGKTGTTQYNTDGWFIMMHPELVAGSWIGFNDSRVTMRSNHWGQGGHNALLVVGDFYRNVLKEELIDPKAKFPKPKRRMASASPTQAWVNGYGERIDPAADSQSGVIVHRDSDGNTFIGDSAGWQARSLEQRTTRSMEEAGSLSRGAERSTLAAPATAPALSAQSASASPPVSLPPVSGSSAGGSTVSSAAQSPQMAQTLQPAAPQPVRPLRSYQPSEWQSWPGEAGYSR